jgi:hypothetical protein
MEKIKDYFDRYPQSDEVFENDGVLFHTRGAADSFSKGDTVKYTRAKVMAEKVDSEELTVDSEELELQKAADELKAKEEAEKAYAVLLETFKAESDITAIKYEALKGYVKGFALVTSDKKQDTFIAALTEFKNTLTVE